MNRKEFIDKMNDSTREMMSREKANKTIEISLAACSKQMKCMVIMEELAELSQQVSKCGREETDKYGLLEEMADVYIGFIMLQTMNGFTESEINKAIDIKLEREYTRRTT